MLISDLFTHIHQGCFVGGCVVVWLPGYYWRNLEGSALQWRHNECDSVSNHRRLDCLPNRLFRRRSKKTSNHRWPVDCPHKGPLTREMFPFDDVIMGNSGQPQQTHKRKPRAYYPWCTRCARMQETVSKKSIESAILDISFTLPYLSSIYSIFFSDI